MAVLLLYTLQLAVNTVKAVSPSPCTSMFLSLCSQVHCFAHRLPPTLAAPGEGRVVAEHGKVPAPRTRSRASASVCKVFFPPCLLNAGGNPEGWNCPS